MKFYGTPQHFRDRIKVNYPPHCTTGLLEEYAEKFFMDVPVESPWIYLPIRWTAWHVNNGYGQKADTVRSFVKSLPRGKKYFTVCQNDDGTMCDKELQDAGCLVFSMGYANPNHVPIPLLCDPHPCVRKAIPTNLACFIGSFNTHPVREQLRKELGGKDGYVFGTLPTEQYRDVMCDSYFCLAPRGYGITSFRLYEAIQMGVIPVYVSDKFWLPFTNEVNYDDFCVRVDSRHIGAIEKVLRSYSVDQINKMSDKCLEVSRDYFNYKSTCNQILRILEKQ